MNYKKLLAAGLMFAGASTVSMGTAQALTVGAGDGYSVQKEGSNAVGKCSINSVGTITKQDGSVSKGAITAGHCGEVGDKVYLDTQQGSFYVGTVVADEDVNSELNGNDWAVIELDDSVELTNTASSTNAFSSFAPIPGSQPNVIHGQVEGQSVPGTFVWKDGATLGRQPGIVLTNQNNDTVILTIAAQGDSGGAVYEAGTGKMVGITSRGPQIFPILIVHNNSSAVNSYEQESGNNWDYYTETSRPHEQGKWFPSKGEPALQGVATFTGEQAPSAQDIVVDAHAAVDSTQQQVNDVVAVTPELQPVAPQVDQTQAQIDQAQNQFNDSVAQAEQSAYTMNQDAQKIVQTQIDNSVHQAQQVISQFQ